MNLALKLKEGTSGNHDAAEQAGFIRCFAKGVLERNTYVRHLEDFYFIYMAMEEALEKNAQDPVISKIYFPDIFRKTTLEKDLEFFHGKDWKSKITLSESGKKYVGHIKSISETKPYLLVAHSYVRYLGDLSGGQILKKIAGKALGLAGIEGVEFYEFPKLENVNEFKKQYRTTLDSLPLNDLQEEEILQEARLVFDLNQAVFKELEKDLIQNIGQEKFDEILKAS